MAKAKGSSKGSSKSLFSPVQVAISSIPGRLVVVLRYARQASRVRRNLAVSPELG